jgi:hypothetical protein
MDIYFVLLPDHASGRFCLFKLVFRRIRPADYYKNGPDGPSGGSSPADRGGGGGDPSLFAFTLESLFFFTFSPTLRFPSKSRRITGRFGPAGRNKMSPDTRSGGSMCSNGNKGVQEVPVPFRRGVPSGSGNENISLSLRGLRAPQGPPSRERNASMRPRAVARSSRETA